MDQELIDACVHCGFCLPTCPTYTVWGEEMDSPRGRIQLMQATLDEDAVSDSIVTHIDRCLGCMACVTACPSGVRYDLLIEQTRPAVEESAERSVGERAWRRLLFALFTHPGRLRALKPATALTRALGISRLAGRGRPGRLRTLIALSPQGLRTEAPEPVTPARGEPRGRVALLQGCVQRAYFGGVNRVTADVLAAEGWEVHAPRDPRCCGALHMHSGYPEPARALARDTIAALGDFDHVVVNAAGCGSSMKHYGQLFAGDSEWDQRAQGFAARVRDATELLGEGYPRASRAPVAMRVAYHDACHLAHAQGVRRQPRALLDSIPELELVEPAGWELCCGSAGIYNLLEPAAAAELGEAKARALLETGAEVIAAANPGCIVQIGAHLERLGRPLPVVHPLELVARSIDGG